MKRLTNIEWTAMAFVFVVAMLVRMPSCFESFWVDELHSAWCIWDSLADVPNRATIGNQSPIYFGGLWFWKQAFGGSEFALRMSSVLTTSIAASVMTLGVSRCATSPVAGFASGLVMALESNAIFFGTELRPYCVVILCSSIATLSFISLSQAGDSRLAWSTLIFSTLVAFLVQPTSLGVLLVLIAVLLAKRLGGKIPLFKFSLVSVVVLLVFFATCWMMWTWTLGEAWRSRVNWGGFAKAPGIRDSIGIFNWLWLLILPLAIVLVRRWFATGVQSRTYEAIALVSVLSVFLFWIASRLGWVHLWQRRYLIAVLPMFAVMTGAAIESVGELFRHWFSRSSPQVAREKLQVGGVRAGVLLILLSGLTLSQGVMQIWFRDPGRLAYRGEGWREAVAWLQAQRRPSDSIYLDAGLIESTHLIQSKSPESLGIGVTPSSEIIDYLCYPMSGPYSVDDVSTIPPLWHPSYALNWLLSRSNIESGGNLWIVSRSPRIVAENFLSNSRSPENFASDSFDDSESSVRSFGGVTVIRMRLNELAQPL